MALKLACEAKNYEWGRLSRANSEVAALAEASGVPIDEDVPYAELWMGTHPSGPSTLFDASAKEGAQGTVELKVWIKDHPESLGAAVVDRFGFDLPFLFKVLSVSKALSIQSHPDKALAERLHAEHPEIYKDSNHKPEMAVALADFEALCGFVTFPELQAALQETPELAPCTGQMLVDRVLTSGEGVEEQRAALKEAFSALMKCGADKVAQSITALKERLMAQPEAELTPKQALVLRLEQQYGNDVGVLSAFFLNLMTLKPYEAIYLPANEPHAYLSGQLVECMATSDNVIRAGLTPKFRDTDTLVDSLTYTMGPPKVLAGEPIGVHMRRYDPTFEEFEVCSVRVPAGEAATLPPNPGPQLVLVQEGTGRGAAEPRISDSGLRSEFEMAKGDVYFIPAGTPVDVTASGGAGSGAGALQLWLAAVNRQVFERVEAENGGELPREVGLVMPFGTAVPAHGNPQALKAVPA